LELTLLAVFVLAALGSLVVGLAGIVSWGLLGFGVDAASSFIGAALLLVLGVHGGRSTLRGERPWNVLAWIALVLIVWWGVYALRN
jgi:hypothetical protein